MAGMDDTAFQRLQEKVEQLVGERGDKRGAAVRTSDVGGNLGQVQERLRQAAQAFNGREDLKKKLAEFTPPVLLTPQVSAPPTQDEFNQLRDDVIRVLVYVEDIREAIVEA